MKAKTIKKLRKKISQKGYYEKRWDLYSAKCKKWESFNRWECNSFFVGEQRAERNIYVYNTEGMRDIRKCEYYKRKVTMEG